MIAIFGMACLLYAGFLAIYANLALRKNRLELHKRGNVPKCAMLIPARYESAVIEGLLKSITKQTVPVAMRDVYVIVESIDDPTVGICGKYGCRVIVREHLELQRKGYALDEAVKQILMTRHYDLYFIFDADNRLAPTYLEEMLKIYADGYEMATGYRNAKNNNRNVIAAVSALTFTMINTIGNKNRIRHGGNIIFSGTGCYVVGELVEKWQGWPFHSLTEDYEMSLYAIANDVSTFYNEKAVFYDEQPTKYRQTVDQRVRWIKGYFSARHKYIPEMRRASAGLALEGYVDEEMLSGRAAGVARCGSWPAKGAVSGEVVMPGRNRRPANYGSIVKEIVGVKPVIWTLIGVICLLFEDIVKLFTLRDWGVIWMMLVGLVLVVYFVLLIITISMIKREKMHFTPKIRWQAAFFNPIYLLTYVPCALKALFIRNVQWKRIEHGRGK